MESSQKASDHVLQEVFLERLGRCHLQIPERRRRSHLPTDGSVEPGFQTSETIQIPIPDDFTSSFSVSKTKIHHALLLQAWAFLLQKYTGSQKSCFGHSNIVGPASAYIVECGAELCSDTAKLSLKGILGQLQTSSLAFTPRNIRSSREFQNSAPFNTAVCLRSSSKTPRSAEDTGSKEDFEWVPQIDFQVNLILHNSWVEAVALFRSSAFSCEAVSAIMETFSLIVATITSDPSKPLQTIDILTTKDLSAIKGFSLASPNLEPWCACLHDIVDIQAVDNPSKIAVCAWDGDLTYQELSSLSTNFGRYLVSRGIKPETFVPYELGKSKWTIVAIIAILKTGAACVPLDSRQGSTRIKEMIGILAATHILCLPVSFEEYSHLVKTAIRIDAASIQSAVPKTDYTLPEVSPDNIAATFFTSGSTGLPKGVLTDHRTMATNIRDHGSFMGINSDSRVMQFASNTFDVSFSDIFSAFFQGACVCMPSDLDRLNNLSGAFKSLNATVACLTPSVVDQLSPADVPSLRSLVVGGEAMSADIINKWASIVDLITIYGVTEAGPWSQATPKILEGDRPSNIGVATCGKTWIVDILDYNKLVPVGAVGELLIEGRNLTRGYLGDEVKTKASFITDPAWAIRGNSSRRFYRTGDLVQYCFDGTIDFLGRRDTQVKINGQRIELGEIEHHLKQILPQESQPAVDIVVPKDKSDQPRLLAFVKARNSDGQDSISALDPALRASLEEFLPRYMIPFAMVRLSQMPMTISGKLDRKVIRQKAAHLLSVYFGNDEGLSAVSQITDAAEELIYIEKYLQGSWATILGINASIIGKHSNFLQLGGDSLRAMKLVSLVRQDSFSLGVSDILTFPVLCKMAESLCYVKADDNSQFPAPFSLLDHQTRIPELYALVGVPIEDSYPCTPIQEGLMALSFKYPGAYIARAVIKLPTEIKIDRYISAWERVIELNPILRTVLIESSLGLLQVVQQHNSKLTRSQNLKTYLEKDELQHISLGDRLVRIGFVHDSQEGPYLVWTAHHAAFDRWSSQLILDQVNGHYNNVSTGTPSPYSQFIRFLGTANQEISKEFWRKYLEGANSTLFPFNRPATYQAHATKIYKRDISFQRPHSLSLTTAALIRASWLLLIASYGGTNDVVTGATLSGRNCPVNGIETMTGPTITTVPIRAHFEMSETVEAFLMRIQHESTAMIPHENLGIRKISQLGSETQAACDFQTLLVVDPYEERLLNTPSNYPHAGMSNHLVIGLRTYALTLQAQLTLTGAQLSLSYDETIFTEVEIQRFSGQLHNLVSQLSVSSKETVLRDLNFVSSGDELVLGEWNSGPLPPRQGLVHEEIGRRMLDFPNALAIDAWDGQLTYFKLDELSSILAHYLVQQWQVGPEIKVPLLFEKSLWTIIAVMGVMKAGGTFVTLDESHPRERLETILRDLKATFIVSSKVQANRVSELSFSSLILNEEFFKKIPTTQTTPLRLSLTPSSALYIIYSSGTTGTPKGSVIEHGAYMSGALAHKIPYAIDRHSRVFQFSSYSFDTCMADILTTLMVGGCICIPSQYERDNDLAGSINRFQANWTHVTPSVADMLFPDEVPCLQTLLLGGEQMVDSHIKKWSTHVKLINVFGPSECCVTCCANSSPVAKNIGFAVGCRAWIVNPENPSKLTPIGGLGELLIEGPLLARGYLNDVKKTAASFIARPFLWSDSEIPMVYRTGDLVRYANDGSLICDGRRDSQIKLNGQRLELGEIEHQLKLLLPTTSVAVEVFPVSELGKHHLAAFIEDPHLSEDSTFAEELKMQLSISLPRFMVPSVFIPVDKIPMSMSGKIDRRQLKLMAQESSFGAFFQTSKPEPLIPPSSQEESELIDLFGHVLKIIPDTIGRNDNVFALGADSVDIMRLVSLCRRRHLLLSVEDIFNHPRIMDMAQVLRRGVSESSVPLCAFSLVQTQLPTESLLRYAAEQCSTIPSSIENIYPCTPLQAGFAAMSLKTPGKFVAQNCWLLSKNIDIQKFRVAWEKVRDSLPILRTSIIALDEHLIQVVRTERLEWHEGSDLESYLSADRKFPMDIGDFLSRFAILQDEQSKLTYFVWTVHHAVYDGWSSRLILAEVEKVYHGSEPSPRPGFDVLLKHLAQADIRKSEIFWRSQLANNTAGCFPQLPNINYQPSPQSYLRHSIKLERKYPITNPLSTLIRASWALLLSQYTNQEDVIFGATLTGRNAEIPGIEDIAGPTFTSVPVRIQVDNSLGIQFLLDRVQSQFTSMIPHEQFGITNIERLATETSTPCKFQSLLVIQPTKSKVEQTYTSGIFSYPHYHGDNSLLYNYAMNLEVFLDDGAVTIDVNYDKIVVSVIQMERLVHQLSYILQQLCLGEVDQLRDIDYVCPEDKFQLLQWNSASLDPISKTIDESFQEHVRTDPSAPAVCAWDGEWTYKELDRLSDRLAGYLETLGVTAGTLIPICFEKSKWVVALMLAIVKAGGGCVLLDPIHYTKKRSAQVVEEVRAKLVICDAPSAPLFSDDPRLRILCFTEGKFNSIPDLQEPYTSKSRPNDTAFIIFTSGSTGTPKGIIHTHESTCSAIIPFNKCLNINKSSRIFQWAAYAFDVAVIDTMSALLHGGCICIPSEDSRINDFEEACGKLGANWVLFTPGFGRLIDPKLVPQLSTICLGGEPALPSDVEQWSGRNLFNGYGPAEASLCVSGRLVLGNPPTIGRPMENNCWIVQISDETKLVPIGAIGQLIVEGPMIASGYLHQPKLSAKGFIRVYFSISAKSESSKAYKTGDLARYCADGTIEFLGRADSQVKIRGQRLELGEIENGVKVYMTSIGVTDEIAAEVVEPKGDEATPRLVIFLFTTSIQPTSIKDFYTRMVANLRNSLPDFMVPSAIIPLKEKPLTATGKMDRKSLQHIGNNMTRLEMGLFLNEGSEIKIRPTTEMEKRISSIWATALRILETTIAASDSFITLGGNSLNAIHVITLAKKGGISMTVFDIFKSRTLSELAAIVETRGVETMNNATTATASPEKFSMLRGIDKDSLVHSAACQCEVEETLIRDIYPCTPLQDGLWALSLSRPGSYIIDLVCQLRPDVKIEVLQYALNCLWKRFDILRTRFVEFDGDLFQTVVDDEFRLQRADDLDAFLKTEGRQVVSHGSPTNSFILVDSKDGSSLRHLVWTVHHATFDGWSASLFAKHMEAAYNGKEVPVIQFSDYISQLVANQPNSEEYWRCQTSQIYVSTYPSLPTNTYQAKASDFLTRRFSFKQGELGDFLPSTILRAGWALLMAKYSGSEDITFGSVLSGRDSNIAGIENLVGPTFATVPICVQIRPQETVEEFLRRIQEQAVDMWSHQNFGLQNIAKLNDCSRQACSFQNLFVIQPRQSENINDRSIGTWISDQITNGFHTYPLTMQCSLGSDYVDLRGAHDSNLIDVRQMQRLMQQYRHILEQLSSRDKFQVFVHDLSYCSLEDIRELDLWTLVLPQQQEYCIHHLIAERAKSDPNAYAVNAWDGHISYSELETKSDLLSQHLFDSGIKSGMKLPLIFEPSMWIVIAILAAIKSGAAFMIIDVHCPRGRCEQMIRDLGAEYILCSTQTQEVARTLATSIVVNAAIMEAMTPSCSSALITPESDLYVIFTSGSTGKPKGCVIKHNAYALGALAHAKRLRQNSSSRVLQFASYAFDASILEILTTLLVGGCICIPSKNDKENSLVQFMRDMRVNWALLTPSLVEIISPSDVPKLKVLVLGGEALRTALIKKWADKVYLCNAYGPSEASVITTVNPGLDINSDPSAIGYSLENSATAWVVDTNNHNQLAAVGTVGELLIEGPVLSSGYLNNEQETKLAFVEGKSFLGRGPRRRYKTGDLVRHNSDGVLCFIGRKDFQIKLRGQRVEPGEIEHQLMDQEAVRQCFVSVPKSGNYKGQLVAVLSLDKSISNPPAEHRENFCVTADISKSDVKNTIYNISEQLTHNISPHMIPTAWLIVYGIPLSLSGKVDRNVARDFLETISDSEIKKASEIWRHNETDHEWTSTEFQLRGLWSGVLNVPEADIDLDTPFLMLGGDSISSMQLASRCRAIGLNIFVQDILKLRTIKKLASHTDKSTMMSVENYSRTPDRLDFDFQLSPIQAVFFDYMPEGNNLFQQGFCLDLQADVSYEKLAAALEKILQRHPMLRARFHRHEAGGWVQKLVSDIQSSFALNICSIEGFSDGILKARQSINVCEGPILTAAFLNTATHQKLYLTAHHLVVDLVSWRIILQDLEEILQDRYLPSPDFVSFQRLAEMQSNRSVSHLLTSPSRIPPASVESLEHFWGLSAAENDASECIEGKFEFGKDIIEVLFGPYCQKAQFEPLDVMLAALIYSYRKTFPNRGALEVLNETHGRDTPQVDVSNVVGWFTAMFPIDVEFWDEDIVLDTMKRVRDCRRRNSQHALEFLPSRKQTKKFRDCMEVLFNFSGRFQQLERQGAFLKQSKMSFEELAAIPRDYNRFSYFEVSADCTAEVLSFSFVYHQKMKHQKQIKMWIQEYKGSLLEAVGHLSKPSSQHAANQFPLCTSPLASLARFMDYRLGDLGIDKSEVEDIFPCSPTQLVILEGQKRDPSVFYDRITFDIKGLFKKWPFPMERVFGAWREVVKHHAALRTIFVEGISASEEFCQVLTWNLFPTITVDKSVEDSDISTVFNTQEKSACLPHFLNIRTCGNEDGVITCDLYISHAVLDGASVPILFSDFKLALQDQLHGVSRPAYREYTAYLAERTQGLAIEYWRGVLSRVTPCNIPIMPIENSARPRCKGCLRKYAVALPDYQRLTNFCVRNDITSSTFFHTVWALTLQTLTNQSGISFFYLISNRDQPFGDISHLVGPVFSRNIFSVDLERSDIEEGKYFSAALEKVKNRDLANLPYQHLSFREMENWVDLEGGSDNLVNSMINYRKWARVSEEGLSQGDLRIENISGYDPWDVDVAVEIEDTGSGFSVVLSVWDNMIDEEQAHEIIVVMEGILNSLDG